MMQVRGNRGWQSGWLLLPLLWMALIWSSTADASWDQSLYRQLGLAGKLDKQTFRQALNSYQTVRHKRKSILTIIDYSKPSTQRRLFVIDMKRHKLLYYLGQSWSQLGWGGRRAGLTPARPGWGPAGPRV